MISPIQFKPLKFFNELVEQNYTILAELESVSSLDGFPVAQGMILEYFFNQDRIQVLAHMKQRMRLQGLLLI